VAPFDLAHPVYQSILLSIAYYAHWLIDWLIVFVYCYVRVSRPACCCRTGDVRQAAASSKTVSSRHHRLSLLVVAVITTSCCGVTAVVTLGVVVVVIRHRRRHHAASSHSHEKSATVTPLIAAFRPPHLPPATPNHHVHMSAPRLLPDVAKCDSDVEEQHQYDILETTSAYFWPVTSGGSMPVVGGGRAAALVSDRCPCSSCLLASTSHASRRCGDVLRQTVTWPVLWLWQHIQYCTSGWWSTMR